jgi:hypothetical protein
MDFDLSKLVRFRAVIIFSLSEREQTRGRKFDNFFAGRKLLNITFNHCTATHLINFETLIAVRNSKHYQL